MAAAMSDFSSSGMSGADGPAKDEPTVRPNDTDTRIDQVKQLEIDEAIRDLDGKLADLEAALHIANKGK